MLRGGQDEDVLETNQEEDQAPGTETDADPAQESGDPTAQDTSSSGAQPAEQDETAPETDEAQTDDAESLDDEAADEPPVPDENPGDESSDEPPVTDENPDDEAADEPPVTDENPGDQETQDGAAPEGVECDRAEGQEGELDPACDPLMDGIDGETLDASDVDGRFGPLLDLLDAGGPIIAILAGLSILTLALVLVKIVQFRVLRVGNRGFVPAVVQHLRNNEVQVAFELVTSRAGVIARVMEAAVRGLAMKADEAHVREEVTRVAQAKLDGLERGLPLLSLIATLSPLLGLLGTVLGMIDAFQQLETAGDRVDPAILSGGIWEALLTTAAGLSVAIPAAAFYTWLQRAVDVAAQRMEDAATQVFTASLYTQSASEPGGE